ncbi:MAG: SRPBCC family protein [Acidimicrobiales bacterium]
MYHVVHDQAGYRFHRRAPRQSRRLRLPRCHGQPRALQRPPDAGLGVFRPSAGVGSKARVRTRALGISDTVEIEVVASHAPTTIVETNVAAKAKRTGQGTYTLEPLPGGGTRIDFEFRWLVAPLMDRLTKPIVRAFIRRNNTRAMQRLAVQLDQAA